MTAADPLQEHMDLVDALARRIAGDDEPRFMVVFQALANQVSGFALSDNNENYRQARLQLRRASSPLTRPAVGAPTGMPEDSIYNDAVFLANARKIVTDRARIIGGVPTTDFPDCVAVGSESAWCCSGTLVAPNVVVTAAHCVEGGCCARVFTGRDVSLPDQGEVIKVRRAVAHPSYATRNPNGDIAVLILDRDAGLAPRPIVTADALTGITFVRLAGYGNTDVHGTRGYGIRRTVDVPIASDDPRWGAEAETEIVAGAPFLDRDSCNGDSGGPAYVQVNGEWLLAGATSRATASSLRPCGDGGIYTKVCSYVDWVRSVPGGNW